MRPALKRGGRKDKQADEHAQGCASAVEHGRLLRPSASHRPCAPCPLQRSEMKMKGQTSDMPWVIEVRE